MEDQHVRKHGTSSVEFENTWEAAKEKLSTRQSKPIVSTNEWVAMMEKELGHYAKWWLIEHNEGVSVKGVARAHDRKDTGKPQHSKWGGLFTLELKVRKLNDSTVVALESRRSAALAMTIAASIGTSLNHPATKIPIYLEQGVKPLSIEYKNKKRPAPIQIPSNSIHANSAIAVQSSPTFNVDHTTKNLTQQLLEFQSMPLISINNTVLLQPQVQQQEERMPDVDSNTTIVLPMGQQQTSSVQSPTFSNRSNADKLRIGLLSTKTHEKFKKIRELEGKLQEKNELLAEKDALIKSHQDKIDDLLPCVKTLADVYHKGMCHGNRGLFEMISAFVNDNILSNPRHTAFECFMVPDNTDQDPDFT